jgi:hypothetical protein
MGGNGLVQMCWSQHFHCLVAFSFSLPSGKRQLQQIGKT